MSQKLRRPTRPPAARDRPGRAPRSAVGPHEPQSSTRPEGAARVTARPDGPAIATPWPEWPEGAATATARPDDGVTANPSSERPDAGPGREGKRRAIVIGVGNPFRRDDGIGEAVVRRLAVRLPDRVWRDTHVVVLDGEPARLVEAWDGAELAVVVDAARSNAAPGEVHHVDLVPGNSDQGMPNLPAAGLASSHGAGVAEAVALGSALGRLPRRLVVCTVTGGDFGDGPGLSPPVAAAVDQVADQIAALLQELADVPTPATRAWSLRVEGVVQGVGFRPFVWRLAHGQGLSGWVRNRDGVVEIFAEGDDTALDRFCHQLVADAPPLARIDHVEVADAEPTGGNRFDVITSVQAGRSPPTAAASAAAPGEPQRQGNGLGVGQAATRDGSAPTRRLVSPDVVICAACLAELRDPSDRRYRYPFVNCTSCGPRFTIIDDLPYDRARTSMARFGLCAACEREYADPEDRRFHAEPVACPACGPKLSLVGADGEDLAGDPVAAAAGLVRAGGIVAIKGLGGYQLACDATDEAAVAELRSRKRRPAKPLAVMVTDVYVAGIVADLRPAQAELLEATQGSIVLVANRGRLAPSVAPGHRRIGLLLPTTPLHHLLLGAVGRPLVMTSGNRSDEPIATNDVDARRRLGDVADAFLVHDRRIAARYDDSVAAVRRGAPAVLRRARGYAPVPVRLPVPVAPTLAVGAELQAAFCLAAGHDAFVGPHVGDLDNDGAIAAYRESLDHHQRLLRIEPSLVAHDLHPDLLSTRLAESLGLPRVAVQHHHAHLVSVMAEHGLTGPVLGVAFDGFGLGADGTAWGGEILACDWSRAERLAHLRPVRQPGGDTAVRYPARMALAHAQDAGRLDDALALLGLDAAPAAILGAATPPTVVAQAEAGLASPLTSSVGRLFDAVAALTGVCREATHEGQPAVLLEQTAIAAGHDEIDGRRPARSDTVGRPYPVVVDDVGGRLVIDSRPLVAAVVADLLDGASPAVVAARFHLWLATAVVETCTRLAERTGLRTVCLAGGVWANDVLLDATADGLTARSFEVHFPRAVPPGDGGLALGQVLVAHAVTTRGT